MKCPCCGSEMRLNSSSYPISIGYGNVQFTYNVNVCDKCGYEIEDKNNEKLMKEAVNKSLYESSEVILSRFKQNNVSFSDIERNFYLPYRTISKWYNKSKIPSASAIELLRIISAFPWMIKAAELGLESEAAQNYARNYYYNEFSDENHKILYHKRGNTKYYLAIVNNNNPDTESGNYINIKRNNHLYKF